MIQIKNMCKKFEEKTIFENYNLEIKKGDFVIINGNSGCGKSTLLNIIGGIEAVDSGEVLVDGKDITLAKNKRKYFRDTVGFLFQNFALLENKTVRQNLNIIKKSGRSDISPEEALEKVGLSDVMDKKVYKLSGGEQQRVALARLMVKKCSLILADEPTGSLDETNGELVMKVLRDLNKEGKTVLVVTHSQKIVKEAKNVVFL